MAATSSPQDILERSQDAVYRERQRTLDKEQFVSLQQRIHNGLQWGVGGVITDDCDNILLVQQDGRWSVPGGGVEPGEDHGDALRREVREETGVEIRVQELQAVTEQRITDGDDRAQFYFATYTATPVETGLTDDPGVDGEGIEAVEWWGKLPENTLDRELLADIR